VDYSIKKEVTVDISMTLDEVRELRELLFAWQREIGQRLPDGPTRSQSEIISTFTAIYSEGIR
jgi:hypothetical protein